VAGSGDEDVDDLESDAMSERGPTPSLSSLPPELHLLIASYLIYPDALSLKHTSRHFYHLVDTGIKLKIDWLVERRQLHLECPNNTKCDLGSDLRFCRGSVRYGFLFLTVDGRGDHDTNVTWIDCSCNGEGNTWSASLGRDWGV
jgi:hypothetical protein